jgi:large subunit ribosomal protein L34
MSTTYKGKNSKRKKTHGFLVRKSSAGGRKIIKRRMAKGRKRVSA